LRQLRGRPGFKVLLHKIFGHFFRWCFFWKISRKGLIGVLWCARSCVWVERVAAPPGCCNRKQISTQRSFRKTHSLFATILARARQASSRPYSSSQLTTICDVTKIGAADL
jgi:hypothetical protein